MNREKEREGGMRAKSGWRKRKRERKGGVIIWASSVFFFSLLSPSSRLDLWWVCVCVCVRAYGECVSTLRTFPDELSQYISTASALWLTLTVTHHTSVYVSARATLCVHMFECVRADVRHWSSEWDSDCMCLHVSCHVQECVCMCVRKRERERHREFCGRDS